MKTCSCCRVHKNTENFNKKSLSKDGLQSKCKDCSKLWYKNYYYSNNKEKERLYLRNKEYRRTVRNMMVEIKSVPCLDCNKSYPYYVMDFDHKYDKKFNISAAVSMSYKVEDILREIEKCDIVCSNCHRIRTYDRRNLDEIDDIIE